MNTLRIVSLAAALAVSAATTFAQTAAPAPAASAADKAMDCGKRHDHGADKGTTTPDSVRCAGKSAKAASKPHDHAKVHK